MAKRLQLKRATAADWQISSSYILLDGEMAVETDTHKVKVGDGKTKYGDLPYVGEDYIPEIPKIEWQDFENNYDELPQE